MYLFILFYGLIRVLGLGVRGYYRLIGGHAHTTNTNAIRSCLGSIYRRRCFYVLATRFGCGVYAQGGDVNNGSYYMGLLGGVGTSELNGARSNEAQGDRQNVFGTIGPYPCGYGGFYGLFHGSKVVPFVYTMCWFIFIIGRGAFCYY